MGVRDRYPTGVPTHWETSPGYLKFLAAFRNPGDAWPRGREDWEGWESALGMPPAEAFEELVTDGVLQAATGRQWLLSRYRVDELSSLLRLVGLKVSGNRQELLDRLSGSPNCDALVEEHPSLAQQRDPAKKYVCSKFAVVRVNEYVGAVEAARKSAMSSSLQFAQQGDLDSALRAFATFAATDPLYHVPTVWFRAKVVDGVSVRVDGVLVLEKVPPSEMDKDAEESDQRDMDEDDRAELLERLSAYVTVHPSILDGMPQDWIESARLAAVMLAIWPGAELRTWWPQETGVGYPRWVRSYSPTRPIVNHGLATAARMIAKYVDAQQALDRFRERRLEEAQEPERLTELFGSRERADLVLAGLNRTREAFGVPSAPLSLGFQTARDDSCSHCREMASREYALDEVPELPHAGCQSHQGCRCQFEERSREEALEDYRISDTTASTSNRPLSMEPDRPASQRQKSGITYELAFGVVEYAAAVSERHGNPFVPVEAAPDAGQFIRDMDESAVAELLGHGAYLVDGTGAAVTSGPEAAYFFWPHVAMRDRRWNDGIDSGLDREKGRECRFGNSASKSVTRRARILESAAKTWLSGALATAPASLSTLPEESAS